MKEAVFSVWVYRLARFALAGVFLWSGIAKLFDPDAFAEIIDAFGLVPETWSEPLSYIMPCAEILTGIGLVLDVRGSLAAIAGFLCLFMGVMAYGIWLGLDVDCGCFGPSDPGAAFHSMRAALVRDIFLLGAVGYAYAWRWKKSTGPVTIRQLITKLRRMR